MIRCNYEVQLHCYCCHNLQSIEKMRVTKNSSQYSKKTSIASNTLCHVLAFSLHRKRNTMCKKVNLNRRCLPIDLFFRQSRLHIEIKFEERTGFHSIDENLSIIYSSPCRSENSNDDSHFQLHTVF
jgi:hypothetical protein